MTDDLTARLKKLLEDIRFAPAEGGYELNQAQTPYGQFLKEHGQEILDRLREARIAPLPAPPATEGA